ncbi:MAG TPA: CHAT domain-containing protein [Aliidongia sp.]|nr:CHAT domain-containing protein [Aliidongia sp.]
MICDGAAGVMRRHLSLALLGAGLMSMLSGCDTLPPGALASAGAERTAAQTTPVGQNVVGEACQFQPGTAEERGLANASIQDVRCGSWVQPSGRVFVVKNGAVDPSRLMALATAGPWRDYLEERMSCEPPSTTRILDGVPAILMQCAQRQGGWPHIAFAASLDGALFEVDGVPSAEPALEGTVASLTNRSVPSGTGQQSSLREALAAKLSSQPFGSGDLDRYFGLVRLGDEQNAVDNFVAAESAFRDALAVQQRILGANSPALVVPLIKLALQISNQRRFDEADGLFNRAESLMAAAPDPLLRARYDYYLGLHRANQQQMTEAIAIFQRSEQGFTRFVPSGMRESAIRGSGGAKSFSQLADSLLINPESQLAVSGLAAVWRYQARIAYDAGKFDEATARARQSHALLDLAGLNPLGAIPRSLLVQALSQQGENKNAYDADSFDQTTKLFNRALPNERPVAVAMFLAGREAARAGDPDVALANFRQGAAILHERKVGLTPDLLLPYLSTLYAEIQAQPAEAPALQVEMFEAAQLVQTGLTAQFIAEAAARLAAGDPRVGAALGQLQEIDLQLKQLFADRDRETQKPQNFQDEKAVAALDQSIADATQRRAEAELAAQSAAPAYGQLLQTGADAKVIQSLLRPHEALLAYFTGADQSFGFVVRPDRIEAYKIGFGEKQIGDIVDRLRKSAQLDLSGAQIKVPLYDLAEAHEFYTALLGPAEAALKDVGGLIIAPSGPLLSLPFEMLVTAETQPVKDDDYGAVPFLLRRWEVSYVPAVQTFVDLRHITEASAAKRPFLGFGDFRPANPKQLAASFPPDRCRQDLDGVESLGALPGTRDEILTVGKLLGARPDEMVLGSDFTKAKLLGADLQDYRIVHLATHALLPTELHCRREPSILLSTASGAANADDAFLGANEVLKLRMDADLVVLSACNTAGPGGGSAGDSLSGLARAFFFAGTRGLLVTHWAVEDNSAKLVATRTLATMQPGTSRIDTAAALRTAKLSLLDGKSGSFGKLFTHPFAWAPFVLIGDGVRVEASGPAAVASAQLKDMPADRSAP